MPNAVAHNGKVYILDPQGKWGDRVKDALNIGNQPGDIPNPAYAVQNSPHNFQEIGITLRSLDKGASDPKAVEQFLTKQQIKAMGERYERLSSVPLAEATIPPGLTPAEVLELINCIEIKKGNTTQGREGYKDTELAKRLFDKAERGRYRESSQNAIEVIAVSKVSPLTVIFEMLRHNLNKHFNNMLDGSYQNHEKKRLLCRLNEAENKFEIWDITINNTREEAVENNSIIVIGIDKDEKYPDKVRIRNENKKLTGELKKHFPLIAETLLDTMLPKNEEFNRHFDRHVQRLAEGGSLSVQGEDLLKIARKLPEIREAGAISTSSFRKVTTDLDIEGLVQVVDKIGQTGGAKSAEARAIERLERLAEIKVMCQSDPALRDIDPEELYKRLGGKIVTEKSLKRTTESLLVFKRALLAFQDDEPIPQNIAPDQVIEVMILSSEAKARTNEYARQQEMNHQVRQQFTFDLAVIRNSSPELKNLGLNELDKYITAWGQMIEQGRATTGLNSLVEYVKAKRAEFEEIERKVDIEVVPTGDLLTDMANRTTAIQKALEERRKPRDIQYVSIDDILENFVPDPERGARR